MITMLLHDFKKTLGMYYNVHSITPR